jgi:large subunit ribosomal protein L25
LKGTRRESLGKGGARKARAAGDIPSVLYGHKKDPVALAVGSRDFKAALRQHKGGNAIVNLDLDGTEITALVRDAQLDPITHDILHLDFQHISLTETIEVSVAVHLVGLAIGVKDGGGILEHIVREVEIRCLPTAIPQSLDIDVTRLNIGESVHASDIKVEGFTLITEPETTIATVVPPTVEDVAAVAGAAEPEVVAPKGKKDDATGDKDKKDKK